MVPAFAAKWLVPRLERFREAEPKIDVRIHGSMERVDFAREPVDMAIRYGTGVYPGLRVDLLMDNEVFPVCSPRLQRGLHPLRKPEDLRHHTLLHLEWDRRDDTWPDWRMWLLAAGARGVDPTRGPRFSQSDFAIEAAIDGQGVALTGRALTSADLAAGRLVRPFELSMPTRFCYYVVCPQARAEEPKIAAFRDWVLAEARGEA
jgi:LysR family glycine cleavage system transcriptional activator